MYKRQAIVRDVVGQFVGKESGGLALLTSKDAIDWKAPKLSLIHI